MACGLWPAIIQSVIEREIKLAFASVEEARAALVAAGAEPLAPRRLQDDRLFDTAANMLLAQKSALRLRREDARALLTFKGPVEPGIIKTREEIETPVGDYDAALTMLTRLGFRQWWRYQKFREEFRVTGAIAAVDETPAGVFIEIEGTEDAILGLAARLHREPSTFILDSYRGIWVAVKGPEAGDMLFAS